MRPVLLCLLMLLAIDAAQSVAQDTKAVPPKLDTSRGDKMLAEYFQLETSKLRDACLADISTLDDWNAKKGEYRRQLLEMLGLDPLPERTDLKPAITGRLEQEEFVVEKLHFQSRPGLYVTGNLYLPKKIEKPLPTILYVCGHGREVKDGVPVGAKTHYQHHGAWFARNGYVCLTIDTLQLGEIEGIHHGTHRYGMWWWLNRGYTPAGVECWNCMRALDYLETRPEVDKTRFGVTGRSGGGAYSWWIAATDERIKCAVPTAGITDLQNHVVDGCVEGHCDCMYMVNTYRWDYPQVAALVAPRPLLIANTDTDRIFPLDGVYRTFEQVRRIYRLHEPEIKGASARVALNITSGGHLDTQELQTHAFRWFNHHLKADDSPIDSRAPKYFPIEQLKVFDKLPDDQINTKIHETFVAKAPPPEVPKDKAAWEKMREGWMTALKAKSFRSWPQDPGPLDARIVADVTRNNIRFQIVDFTSQPGIPLRMFVVRRTNAAEIKKLFVNVSDDDSWQDSLALLKSRFGEELRNEPSEGQDRQSPFGLEDFILSEDSELQAAVFFSPRGTGRNRFDQNDRKQVQNRRRFYLLGQTLDAMQVWDIRRAVQVVRHDPDLAKASLILSADGASAAAAVYASLFEPGISTLALTSLARTHREGLSVFNSERFVDMPQAVAMAAERSQLMIEQNDGEGWQYPTQVAKVLGWAPKQLRIGNPPTRE